MPKDAQKEDLETDESPLDDDEISLEEAIEAAYEEALEEENQETLEPQEEASKEPEKEAAKESDKKVSRQLGDKEGSEPKPDEAKEPEKVQEQNPANAIEPPVSWRMDAKEAWGKLPADLQKEVKRVEEAQRADYLQKTRELSNKEEQLRQSYGDLPEVIRPYLHAWSAEGKTPGQAVGNLLQMQNFASTQPDKFLLWYANTYGVDVSRIANAQRAGVSQDPGTQHMNRELAGINQRLSRHEAFLKQREEAARKAEEDNLAREVEAFQSATDETGSLKHPYLRDVLAEFKANIPLVMRENANAHPQEVFKEAYERAVHANPVTRSKVLQGLEEQRLSRIQEDTAKAERAGKLITGNAAGNDKLPDADDLDAVIRYAWDKHAEAGI